jgi:anti-anti-sigma factor
VTVTTRADGAVVLIIIDGEIDLSNANYVEREIGNAISNRSLAATIDLTSVGYIDSIGMRVLFALSSRLDTAQIEFKIIAPVGSPAHRVIEISGLDSIVDIVESGP